jgi:hypothetical protein
MRSLVLCREWRWNYGKSLYKQSPRALSKIMLRHQPVTGFRYVIQPSKHFPSAEWSLGCATGHATSEESKFAPVQGLPSLISGHNRGV